MYEKIGTSISNIIDTTKNSLLKLILKKNQSAYDEHLQLDKALQAEYLTQGVELHFR